MANLVNNLLDLSHAAHGRLDLDGRPVALSALLEQLQDAIAPDFDDKGGSQSNRAPSWRGPRSTSKLRRRSSDSLAS
jgi:signal transduction histidine kinase